MDWKRDKMGTKYRYGDTQLTVDINEYSNHSPVGWNIYWGSEIIQQRNTREVATKWAQGWYKNRIEDGRIA